MSDKQMIDENELLKLKYLRLARRHKKKMKELKAENDNLKNINDYLSNRVNELTRLWFECPVCGKNQNQKQ